VSVLEAILLGTVQGLTEFLPISSSGHLVLMQHFLGVSEGQVTFDVVLHLGTLGAVMATYRHSLGRMAVAVWRALTSAEAWRRPLRTWQSSEELRWVGLLVLGSIPTALIGFFFQAPLEAAFSSPRLAAVMLLVTGAMLQLPKLRRSAPAADEAGAVRAWQAPIVGVLQGLAIIPGISRSGATISGALLMGVPARQAARFSFLLSIPAILGATALKMTDVEPVGQAPLVLVVGAVSAFVVGWAALMLLLQMLRRGRFSSFSIYCFALGVAALIALGVESG
jgi:undecaprenyl-diphosphatase